MDESEILTRLGLSLAIGFLIGLERGWGTREEAEGERTAGLRTFALIGLFGGLSGLLSQTLGPAPLAVAFIGLAAGLTLFRWRETEREGTNGATTLIAGFLTFGLGAYAILGEMSVAAAAAVATTALLAAKGVLHTWLKRLSWEELRATLILLAMSFVVLPVLPDRNFGPYDALNLRTLWLMTIAIAAVSFVGYVAVKVAGDKLGVLLAGVAGGLVSSTAATLNFARQAKTAPGGMRLELGGAFAASATMFARVGVVVALFGPQLLTLLAAPLAAAAVVLIAASMLMVEPWRKSTSDEAHGLHLTNPFDLRVVFGFAALLAVILVLTKVFVAMFGLSGGVVFAAIAGLGDVDAITLSMTQLAAVPASLTEAAIAILVAVSANSLSKTVIAFGAGGQRFGAAYGGTTVLALAAGGVVAMIQHWA